MQIRPPTLSIGKTEKEMVTTATVADTILKFSNQRQKIPIENFLQEHIKILATAFDVTADEIKNEMTLTDVVKKYFDCLEYVARVITKAAETLERKRGGKNENTKLYH